MISGRGAPWDWIPSVILLCVGGGAAIVSRTTENEREHTRGVGSVAFERRMFMGCLCGASGQSQSVVWSNIFGGWRVKSSVVNASISFRCAIAIVVVTFGHVTRSIAPVIAEEAWLAVRGTQLLGEMARTAGDVAVAEGA